MPKYTPFYFRLNIFLDHSDKIYIPEFLRGDGAASKKVQKNCRLFHNKRQFIKISIIFDYAIAFLATSVRAVKPAASLTARSASILRLISTPAVLRPYISWL